MRVFELIRIMQNMPGDVEVLIEVEDSGMAPTNSQHDVCYEIDEVIYTRIVVSDGAVILKAFANS